jgi:hypothetical protein
MKKSVITIILSLTLLSGVSLASISSTLVETPLLPTSLNSFPALDLFPSSSPKAELDFSKINLNPRLVSLHSSQALVEPNFRGSGFGDSMFDASLLSLIALNVADYVSTRECLKYPHLSEGNPVMKPFVKDPAVFAAVKGGLTIISVLGTRALYKRSKPLGWIVSIASNLALSYVVSNNVRLLQQARAR